MKKNLLCSAVLAVATILSCNAMQMPRDKHALNQDLIKAVQANDPHEIKVLVGQGADPNEARALSVVTATYSNPNAATIRALLDAGANLNEPKAYPAFINIIAYLRRAKPNSEDMEIIKMLFDDKYRANIHQTNREGETVLDVLDRNGRSTNYDIVRFLERKGIRRSGQSSRVEDLRGYHERQIRRSAPQQ